MLKIKLIYLTLFMLFQQSPFFSQLSEVSFDKQQGYWSIGAQYGNNYQWSDVESEVNGWGTSLVLGKNLFYRDYALLALDLRSRIFFGVSRGLDGVANANIANNEALNGTQDYDYLSEPGYFFNNYKNSFLGIDLEPNLFLNKYRAETGWFMNLYGGAGLGVYNTRMDLSNGQGDYSSSFENINQNASSSSIKKEVKTILDGSYESQADGFYKRSLKLGFMPSVGLEVGYDINRFLTAYLGHRTLFSRSDFLDGFSQGNPNNDLLNFTHIGLQVNFHKNPTRNSNYRSGFNDSDLLRYSDEPEQGLPQVKIVYPEVDWFNTSMDEIEVSAILENVYSVLDISCMVNGKEVAFDYDKDEVKFYADLQRGTNVLKVQVRNDKGEARDIKRVIYTPVETTNSEDPEFIKPAIEMVAPESLNFSSPEDIFSIQAYIEHVESKDDIKLNANGMDLNTFNFDPAIGLLSIKVRLAKGTNKFTLTAYNSGGKTEQEFRIYYGVDPETEIVIDEEGYEEDEADNSDYPPIETNTKAHISILSPVDNPYYTKNDKVDFRAEMHGVDTKDDIEFYINGKRNLFFDFDVNNKILSDEIHLMDLETLVEILARNSYGETTKDLRIIYGDKPVIEDSPVNKLIEDVDVGKPDEDCFSEFEVTFSERIEKEAIKITMNDFEVRNFRYKAAELRLRFSLFLDEGNNDVIIEVNTGDKSESARVNLKCGESSDNEIVIEDEVIEDTSPANLESVSPNSGYVSEEEDVILRFKAAHVKSTDNIMVFLNDQIIEDVEFDSFKNEAQVLLSLSPKENDILIRISNDYGTDEKTLMFFYDEPFKTAPEVIINSPRNGFETDENTVIFRASVDFIKSIDDVSVLYNNEVITDFSYNEEFGKVQAILPLKLGNNTLEVSAKNKVGSSSDKVSFKYKMEHVPGVKITGPKEGLEYRKSFAMLTGIVQNMSDQRGIGIQINGKAFKSLNYDEKTETVTSRLLLEKGENEIVLSAKSEYGFASDTIRLFFKGAPEKPYVRFVRPAEDGENASNSLYNLEAEVQEISHSSHVQLTVNGTRIDDVYYFKNETMVRAEFKLKKGRNDIKLVAINDTGNTTARTYVYLK